MASIPSEKEKTVGSLSRYNNRNLGALNIGPRQVGYELIPGNRRGAFVRGMYERVRYRRHCVLFGRPDVKCGKLGLEGSLDSVKIQCFT